MASSGGQCRGLNDLALCTWCVQGGAQRGKDNGEQRSIRRISELRYQAAASGDGACGRIQGRKK